MDTISSVYNSIFGHPKNISLSVFKQEEAVESIPIEQSVPFFTHNKAPIEDLTNSELNLGLEESFLIVKDEKVEVDESTEIFYLDFKISNNDCPKLVKDWLDRKWCLPANFKGDLSLFKDNSTTSATTQAIFIPFWLFRNEIKTPYEAEVKDVPILADIAEKMMGSTGLASDEDDEVTTKIAKKKDPYPWRKCKGTISYKIEEYIQLATKSIEDPFLQQILQKEKKRSERYRKKHFDKLYTEQGLKVVPISSSDEQPPSSVKTLPIEITKEDAWQEAMKDIAGFVRAKMEEELYNESKGPQMKLVIGKVVSDTQIIQQEPPSLIYLPFIDTEYRYADKVYRVLISAGITFDSDRKRSIVGNRPVGSGLLGEICISAANALYDSVAGPLLVNANPPASNHRIESAEVDLYEN